MEQLIKYWTKLKKEKMKWDKMNKVDKVNKVKWNKNRKKRTYHKTGSIIIFSFIKEMFFMKKTEFRLSEDINRSH